MVGLCAFMIGTFWQGSPKVPTMADLDKIVALYKELHLPLPPANAVLADRGYRRERGKFSLADCGYAIPVKNKHGWYTVFRGTEPDEDPNPAKPVTSDTKNFASLDYEFRDSDHFSQADAGLAMAAIEKIRGHDDFALAIFQKWAGKPDLPDNGPRKSNPDDPRQALTELALLHWYNACLNSDIDRTVIVNELKNLVRLFPNVGKNASDAAVGKGVSDEANDGANATIERLELTIKNRYKGADKVEQLIDSLCDGTMVGNNMEYYGIVFTEHAYDNLQALASIGYKAIPQLIAHFDDKRLVRSLQSGETEWNGRRIRETYCPITSVGTVCANLVSQFTDKSGFGGYQYSKDAQKKWWAEASKNSDIDNCWASLSAKNQWLSQGPMWFASAHHPDLLLKALDVILERKDETQIYSLLAAIARSNLDRKVVINALVKASKSTISDQAHAGVVFLKKVSPSDNDEALIRILKDLPKSSTQKAWLSREAIYGKSVAQSESPAVWDAYKVATKRAELDLRLEMIRNASYADHTPAARKLYLKYLSAFFDDKAEATEETDIRNRQHFDLPSLRVQYLALILAAYQVKERPIPKKSASVEEWSTFRKAVEAKVKTEN